MPRQPRLDAPGTLHHVIARGIERQAIYVEPADYADFLGRLERVTTSAKWSLLAWALLPNHFHLLVRTGPVPLASAMRSLMTGYAVAHNRRHRRYGHVFQNRYKSIVCEEEAYLLELIRYIHLNPLRAGRVESLEDLDSHPYSGHCALMGGVARPWQSVDEVLGQFGNQAGKARANYREFIGDGVSQGHRPELVGGGLIRSAGGWAQVLGLRQRKERVAADERILGSSEFVEALLEDADQREGQALRLGTRRPELADVERDVSAEAGLLPGELRTGGRRRAVVEARRALIRLAVRQLGYSGAEVARHLGVTTSCVTREAGRAAQGSSSQCR